MKHSKLDIFMIFVVLAVGLTFGFAWYQASAHGRKDKTESVRVISESIHLTKDDGVKSLGQVIREQSDIAIPAQTISKIHFLVDAGHSALIFPRNDFQPEGFEFAISPGDGKMILVPEIPISAEEALNVFLIKSSNETNFIVQIEFESKR